MRELIRISKALSDETRIRMLKLLAERDVCICEMQEIFPLSISQISRGLKILMDAGFLARWREGKCVVYAASNDSNINPFCRALLNTLAASFNDDESVIKDRENLKRVIEARIRELKK